MASETPSRTTLLLSPVDRARADVIATARTGRPGLSDGIRVALLDARLDAAPLPVEDDGGRTVARVALTEAERARALDLAGASATIGDGVRRALAIVAAAIPARK